jgi:hypothetical protein
VNASGITQIKFKISAVQSSPLFRLRFCSTAHRPLPLTRLIVALHKHPAFPRSCHATPLHSTPLPSSCTAPCASNRFGGSEQRQASSNSSRYLPLSSCLPHPVRRSSPALPHEDPKKPPSPPPPAVRRAARRRRRAGAQELRGSPRAEGRRRVGGGVAPVFLAGGHAGLGGG